MRLWHKDLIPVLPDKQLLCQWRECCAIAKNIATKGTPNHILVNKIMDYPIEHFFYYTSWVIYEMRRRGYKVVETKFTRYYASLACGFPDLVIEEYIFPDWHNDRYYVQCFFNLQEKYDCGGISKDEYAKLCSALIEYCCKKKDWKIISEDFDDISPIEMRLE